VSVTYNGITFSYPRTEVNVMSPGMDPSSSDQLYTTIRLKVRAYLNIAALPSNYSIDQGNVANTLTRIRHYLTQPRAPLYYDLTSAPGTVGAAPIINLPDGRDDANGPLPDPDAFSVTYTTPATLEVTWACTVKLRDCGFALTSTPLSLRWEDTIEFDRYWKATYRRVGTIIISSRSTISLDQYRRTVLAPTVAPGFAREAAHYTVSRDGLRCDFAFVDGQIRYAPPYPAVDMDVVQQESLPLLGAMRKGQINVSMRGMIHANPVDLQNLCTQVAFARLNASNPLASSGKVIGTAVFRSAEAKDSVQADFTVSYSVAPDSKTKGQNTVSTATWASGLIGLGIAYLAGRPTQQGKATDQVPILPWVGYGTSPTSPSNAIGFAKWADPSGAINGPSDGVMLAPAIKLFAALLSDPCGVDLKTDPAAGPVEVELRTTDPNGFNTELRGGNGGATQISTSQLTASLSTLNASEYPTTINGGDSQGSLYSWDGLPGAYDYWQCLNEYLGDPGVLVVPTSDSAGTNVAIAHSSSMTMLRKRWAAMRTGSPPRLPPTELTDPNWVFVNSYEGIREMRVASDGVSMVYEASGIYEYQALDASKVVRGAELQPFLVASFFEGPSGPANWVQAATTAVLTAGGAGQQFTSQVLTGSGGNPLGGNVLPGAPSTGSSGSSRSP